MATYHHYNGLCGTVTPDRFVISPNLEFEYIVINS